MLRERILTAAIGIPLGLAVMWLGGWYLAAAVAVIAVLGLREFHRMVQPGRDFLWLEPAFGVVVIALTAADRVAPSASAELVWEAVFYASLLVMIVVLVDGRRVWPSPIFRALPVGFLYIPMLLVYLLHLRALSAGTVRHTPIPTGAVLLFIAMGACWATDAAAYLVGRKIGKHKLAPKISPGKTVEGGVAGLLGGMVLVGALGTWVGIRPVWAIGLGALLAVAAQVGDLFESWLKRRAGVKDSGSLLPGHGGILDRFDSLLLVAPVAYYCLRALL